MKQIHEKKRPVIEEIVDLKKRINNLINAATEFRTKIANVNDGKKEIYNQLNRQLSELKR